MDPTTGSGQVQTPVQPQVPQTQGQAAPVQTPPPAQPVVPSVSIHKEQAPVAVSPEQVMQPTEAPPQLHPEVLASGVEHVTPMPPLTSSQQQAGIELAKESVPHPVSPSGMVQLPLTAQQAQQVVKTHKKVTDSIFWLATLILMQFKRMHGKLTGN